MNFTELEEKKPLTAECSVIATTVIPPPPADYCSHIEVTGSETSHFGISGSFHRNGDYGGRPAWKHLFSDWYILHSGSGYGFFYGRSAESSVAISAATMSYCAADADLTWKIWNNVAMVDVGTCDGRFCLFSQGLTTTKKPGTGSTSSTASTSSTPTSSTAEPTGDCASVELVGNEAKRFRLNCVYVKTNSKHNNFPIYQELSPHSLMS